MMYSIRLMPRVGHLLTAHGALLAHSARAVRLRGQRRRRWTTREQCDRLGSSLSTYLSRSGSQSAVVYRPKPWRLSYFQTNVNDIISSNVKYLLLDMKKHGAAKLENKGTGEKRNGSHGTTDNRVSRPQERINDASWLHRPMGLRRCFSPNGATETNRGCKFVLTPRSILFGSPEAAMET
ncbi:unnamed protein product, partial [Iphiclides podalirius]